MNPRTDVRNNSWCSSNRSRFTVSVLAAVYTSARDRSARSRRRLRGWIEPITGNELSGTFDAALCGDLANLGVCPD
ncbi:MAG: hypothetical protein H6711_03200 [Myxococcales bacterium]|nr:hypothetical protein [Myxococcales bacterium]